MNAPEPPSSSRGSYQEALSHYGRILGEIRASRQRPLHIGDLYSGECGVGRSLLKNACAPEDDLCLFDPPVEPTFIVPDRERIVDIHALIGRRGDWDLLHLSFALCECKDQTARELFRLLATERTHACLTDYAMRGATPEELVAGFQAGPEQEELQRRGLVQFHALHTRHTLSSLLQLVESAGFDATATEITQGRVLVHGQPPSLS